MTQSTNPGPHPLALHLALQTMLSASSLSVLSALKNGSLPWNPALVKTAEDLRAKLNNTDFEDFTRAVEAEGRRRVTDFNDGVRRYWSQTRRTPDTAPAVVWSAGTTRLLDYSSSEHLYGPPLLVIPSLINRYHVLDLHGERSFMRALAQRGFRAYVVDWDAPTEQEKPFNLSDYVTQRLEPMLDHIHGQCGAGPVGLIGYCMGGLLALALAARQPSQCGALALLATPWDFHVGHTAQIQFLSAMAPQMDRLIDAMGVLPAEVLQAMFVSLDPWITPNKFRRFAHMTEGAPKADLFVELEDWINGGPPLAGRVARECLHGWYVENTPMQGHWKIAGQAVLPKSVETPSLAMIPAHDHIVPPDSALALANALPNCEHIILERGHIGMIASSHADKHLIEPLTRWLNDNLNR